ncbi:PadR family transcriptional regulator [Saccharibacillus alkalitolerans]|uniref:PadR family transcriptional regulator n=1 Tax=Saccharibacillus alkalitolerans TaxID=2705290 RepID=A0ABX0FB54_9BACL|nr:PadR family transcriptional regulator [Saccharibacillus alkalitolerans]NGZ75252.1 PadR family transcriptional regulator [Saccharibacillus alkalitolerans]
MKRINTTHFAILGLLRIKPMSAYELVKFSKESIGLFWNESYGHIHKSIKQLETEGDVEVVEEAATGRRKIVYGVTGQGRERLDSWLVRPPEESVIRNELLMKVFVADESRIPQIVAFVEEELRASEEMTAVLAGIRSGIPAGHDRQTQLWLLTLDYGERYVRMTTEWCRHALDTLNHPNEVREHGYDHE